MSCLPRTVLVAGGLASSLVNFRASLLRDLRAAGHRVIATAAEADARVAVELGDWGVVYRPLALERAGLNPLSDRRYLIGLRRMMDNERPDVVIAYTHKPVVYSALAAGRQGRTLVYPLVTGLGYTFIECDGLTRKLARRALMVLYRRASRWFNGVMFQNPDDLRFFQGRGLIRPGTPWIVVRGSGVDLDRFRQAPHSAGLESASARSEPVEKIAAGVAKAGTGSTQRGRVLCRLRFLLIARLLRDKGIGEFVSAARDVNRNGLRAEFHLVGPEDPSPSAIPVVEVRKWHREGVIVYHGEQADVRPFLRDCTVYVLPSYREGTPRTVLEAMAIGRAIITTDSPGCRETIFGVSLADGSTAKEGWNGFLVPVRSVDGLVAGITRFLENPGLADLMGRQSRRLAEEYYDVRKVNRAMLDFMSLT